MIIKNPMYVQKFIILVDISDFIYSMHFFSTILLSTEET